MNNMGLQRIPKQATCVWKGNILSARTREQKLFDGTYKTFEMVKRFDSIQGIIIDGDSIILPYEIQPHQSRWNYGLRGGMLEEGEDHLEAMKRELLEETGMKGDVEFRIHLEKGGFIVREEFHYIVRNTQKVQDIQFDAGGENILQKRLTFEEFMDVVVSEFFRNSTFSAHIMREYVVPQKLDELRKILFKL